MMKISLVPCGIASVVFLVAAAGCQSKDDRPAGSAPQAASAEPERPWGGPDLTSNLGVPAGQRFIFAGGQPTGYTAYVTNTGSVPITILAEIDGTSRPIVTLEPGHRASRRFEPREAALFENRSGTDAQAKVEIWGNTNVGMRYIKLP
jgi:hypothetical protein